MSTTPPSARDTAARDTAARDTAARDTAARDGDRTDAAANASTAVPRAHDAGTANARGTTIPAAAEGHSGAAEAHVATPATVWEPDTVELGWPTLLSHLARCCSTPRGAARASQLPPLPDAASVTEMIALVSEARALAAGAQWPAIEPIAELGPALLRLAKDGALSGAALYEVARTLQSLATLRALLTGQRALAPRIAARAAALHALEHVWRPILACCEPDGALADHASAELGALRRRVRELKQRILQQMKRLLETPRIAKQLQDHYFTEWEDRCVLPVRAEAASAIDGLVLGCSASGATIFVEPTAVLGLSNELKVQQVAVARETARLLAELSALVGSEHARIAADLELATELDLIVARARLAQRLDAQPAAVAEDAQLVLRGLRHPLLLLAGGEVVAHDVALLPQQALLISGPNAGGKSVCLKGVGLCALMLRCGMHLPVARESRLPCYHHVWANLGDEQSIERNLSTFTGHLGRLLGYLERADRGTLLLLDEITTGTDPGEGAALGQALLEALVERVAQLVVTTHYDTLKTLPLGDRRFVNASVGFDLQRLEPTFELHRGVPGSSFALAVARRLGLPAALSTRAQHLLGEQATLTTELLVTLTDERTRLRQAQQQHAAAEQRAVAEREGYERQRLELRQRDQQALTQAHREALTELQRARGELKQLRAALRRSAGPEPARGEPLRTLDRQLSVLARTIGAHEPRPAPPPGPKLQAEALVVGAQVQLAELGAPAEIVELPQRGRVTVLLGGLRTKVRLDQLHALAPPADHGAGPAAAAPRSLAEPGAARAAAALDTPGRGPDNTLDLRGLRVEEALRATDRFVDRSLLEGRELVYVLHGHGSGALRAAVRAALERSPSVERCRAAAPDQGGEALTMVWLR